MSLYEILHDSKSKQHIRTAKMKVNEEFVIDEWKKNIPYSQRKVEISYISIVKYVFQYFRTSLKIHAYFATFIGGQRDAKFRFSAQLYYPNNALMKKISKQKL